MTAVAALPPEEEARPAESAGTRASLPLVKADPRLRRDGRCARCGKKRAHAVANRYSGDQAVRDPFCSAGCARAWHQVSDG